MIVGKSGEKIHCFGEKFIKEKNHLYPAKGNIFI